MTCTEYNRAYEKVTSENMNNLQSSLVSNMYSMGVRDLTVINDQGLRIFFEKKKSFLTKFW